MRADWRLTELLARLHVFSGPLPRSQHVEDRVQGLAARRNGGLDSALAGLSPASRARIVDPLGSARATTRVGRPAPVSLPFIDDSSGHGAPLIGKVSAARTSAGVSMTALSSGSRPTATAPARQVDQTTCGSAVLSMLAMAGDPWLTLQVARDPARRFASLQLRVHRACSRAWPVPWPSRLGTAPWAAAAVARFGDVRYTHRLVGGSRRPDVLRAVIAAASSGIPVPLYTGGDLRAGWQAAVPRHVVLLVDATPEGAVRIYEPSSATLHAVPTAALLDPDAAAPHVRAMLTAALGSWPHVVWAVLPR